MQGSEGCSGWPASLATRGWSCGSAMRPARAGTASNVTCRRTGSNAVRARRRARQQLSGFLLRQGCHYGRPAWTKLHRRHGSSPWAEGSRLTGLRFEHAVHHIVLEDYIQAVEAAEARRDRLTAQIEAMLPDWTLAPVVAALQTMRGMALVNAATLRERSLGLVRL